MPLNDSEPQALARRILDAIAYLSNMGDRPSRFPVEIWRGDRIVRKNIVLGFGLV